MIPLQRSASGRIHLSVGVLFVALMVYPYLHAQEKITVFNKLSIEQGLSQDTVTAVLQDQQGFIWVGTTSGLNRFDGYSVVRYTHDPDDETSLCNNRIYWLLEDHAGMIWVATTNGLDCFDPRSETFTHYRRPENAAGSRQNDIIWTIVEDTSHNLWVGTYRGLSLLERETGSFTDYHHGDDNPDESTGFPVMSIMEGEAGELWLGTWGEGVTRFDPSTGESTQYRNNPDDPQSLSNEVIYSMVMDAEGAIWVGTAEGLNRLDPETGRCRRYKRIRGNTNSLCHNIVNFLVIDPDQNIWIGTANGLDKLDPASGRFTHYRHQPGRSEGLASSTIYCLFLDNVDNLWIGTHGGGLNWTNLKAPAVELFEHRADDPNSLSEGAAMPILRDGKGDLWIGTFGGGLNRYNERSGSFTHFRHRDDDRTSLSDDRIHTLMEDSQGRLWIGTLQGLNRYRPQTQTFVRYQHRKGDSGSLSHNTISAIVEDQDGIIWIGTANGLNRFDPEKNRFQWIPDQDAESDYVRYLCADGHGNIWLGTYGNGVKMYDRESGLYTRYFPDANNPHSLRGSVVQVIMEDSNSKLWIGTYDGGLNRLDPETGKFTNYQSQDGLPSDAVFGILEDLHGYLWISTNRGICRFDPRSEQCVSFDRRDGFANNVLHTKSFHRDVEGRLYFGGTSGVIRFSPQDIIENLHVPPVRVTRFYRLNEPLTVCRSDSEKKGICLDQSISYTQELTLSYRDKIIAFEFAVLNYHQSHKNRFAHQLVGFDDDWIETDHRNRRVTYTNLSPGSYIFRTRGSNNDGHWNDGGQEISLTILPPFWQTWWFRALTVLLVLLAIYRWHRSRMLRITQRLKSEAAMERFFNIKGISKREREIVLLILQGKSNKEIEDELYISLGTVKNHIYNIYKKLEVDSRYQLINQFKNLPIEYHSPD